MKRCGWRAIPVGFCLLAAVVAGRAQAPGARGDRPFDPFRQFDRNQDGRLTKDEMPPKMAETLFGRIDRNGDGAITREEDEAFQRSRGGGGGERPQAGGAAQGRSPRGGALPEPPVKPDFADVKYGPHERNVFDLWKAKGEGPRPLVIFYHGGGFRGGDKRQVSGRLLEALLAKGVSVAAANYRLTDSAPYPAQMHDSARALQFIRLHAEEYGIDPRRVGATGGSAGAGISQWLLMHDDLADAKSDDPVLRQSSRIQCAVATAAQSTYDPRVHQQMFNVTGVESAMFPFYGLSSPEDVRNPKFFPLFEDASPITHATKDDGPLMLFYPQANEPLPENAPGNLYIHHPKFGFLMKEKLDKLGVECVLKLREDYAAAASGDRRIEPTDDYVRFFVGKLKP